MLPTRVLLSAVPSSGSPKEPQAVEFLQREVDRTWEVLVFELVRRKDLDELGILFAPKALKLVTIDRCGHVASLVKR